MIHDDDPNKRHLHAHDVTRFPICNACGLSTALPDYDGPKGIVEYPGGLLRATVDGGFSSTPGNGFGALDDLTFYRFSLCEYCVDALMALLVVPPLVWEGDRTDDLETFRPAAQRVADDEWRHGNEKDVWAAESTKRAALRRFGK